MSKKKILKKILVSDVARAARKLQEEKDGDRELSGYSGTALREIALGFEDQYSEQQSKNASSRESKKVQGLWLAIKELRQTYPNMEAREVWETVHGRRIGTRWILEIEDGEMQQIDNETGQTKSVTYNTFVRHYFSEVLKS